MELQEIKKPQLALRFLPLGWPQLLLPAFSKLLFSEVNALNLKTNCIWLYQVNVLIHLQTIIQDTDSPIPY